MKKIYKYLYLVIILLVAALNFNLFLKPLKLVTGGTQGLAIILNQIFNIKHSTIILFINILMLILSYLLLSKKATFGTVLATFFYPLFVSTQVPYRTCVCMMLTVLLPACFNLGYSMKYRVLLLTDQKEYIISLISTFFYTLGNVLAIFMLQSGVSLLVARVAIMIFLFIGYYMLGVYCKKHYSFLNFNIPPLYEEIKGTKSVLILKATSVLYTTAPIILISALPDVGAMIASVYAVYKNVISFVSNCLVAITNAPRLGVGSLLAEKNIVKTKKIFYLYEKISFIGISIILGTTCLLIIPFVDLYTKGINDINYRNKLLAGIMLLTIFLEAAHIPSGQIIQMSGAFDVAKKIQSVAFVALLIGLFLGKIFFGLYGILVSVLIAALILCFLEIGYVSVRIIKRKWSEFLINMIPSVIICCFSIFIGFSDIIICHNYFEFIVQGIISCFLLFILSFAIYYIIDSNSIKDIVFMMKRFISVKRIKEL